jgi:hypothetical protein
MTGDLTPAWAMQPANLRASSLNPAYQQYPQTRGRQLAGLGDNGSPLDYPTELNSLQVTDDVDGNGVFDPPGSQGNIHADAGIFADHASLPGYLAREQFYRPSEVMDATTGRPVMYVPGGAVAIDPQQREALETLIALYEPGPPFIKTTRPPMQSTVVPQEQSWGINGLGEGETVSTPDSGEQSPVKMFIMAAIAGVAIGAVIAVVKSR